MWSEKTKAHLTLAHIHVPDHVPGMLNFDLFSVDIVFFKKAVWYSVIVEEGVRKVLHVVAQTLNSGTTPNIASIYQPKTDNKFRRHL